MSSLVAQLAPLVECREWEQVRGLLSDAYERDELRGPLLETFADASWWLGRVNECMDARRRALDDYQRDGDPVGAARMALLLSEDHRRQGRAAVAESWRRRAARLLEGQPESAAHGYLLLYQGEVARRKGDLALARALLADARRVADRVADADLVADVTQESGRLLIVGGAHAEGLAVMDDAMLAATDGGLSPYTTGKIYCCLMSACADLGDVQRVAEWERTSSSWSRAEGAKVFPGMCRVHHAELLAHHGQWSDAEHEAARACEELREVGWVASYAWTTLGQIRCRRGDLIGAAEAFGRSEELGDTPEAGLSLLLLARGEVGRAMNRISRALAATSSPPLTRARLLPALVEIAIAAGDLPAASTAAAELDQIADAYGTLKLQATASLARSRICLAQDDWVTACATAARAMHEWQELAAPYEVATARVLQARACRALDDHDTWRTSLDIAADIFRSLGAVADLAKVEGLRANRRPDPRAVGSLTAREVVVLQLVATGATNKMIAAELVVSQKTVARHLSNLFAKLGVSTRAAATAYAYEQGLARTAR